MYKTNKKTKKQQVEDLLVNLQKKKIIGKDKDELNFWGQILEQVEDIDILAESFL